MKIGVYNDILPVYVSSKAPNQHVAVFGMSGTGKSTRIAEMAESAVEEGKMVIALDLSGADFTKLENVNYISALEDGIDIKLLESNNPIYIRHITGIFQGIFGLGDQQVGTLRVALNFAVENKKNYPDEMTAIAEGLRLQDTRSADTAYNRLWGMLSGNIIRKSKKQIYKNAINVISFKGLTPQGQREMAEFLISILWLKIRETGTVSKKMVLIIDEFQNYVRKDSVLLEMLREARKYNVSIIIATQSVEDMSKE